MKIRSGNEIADYVNRSNPGEVKKSEENAPHEQRRLENSKDGAFVDLSQRSKDVQRLQKAIQSEPDMRMEKVEAIRKKIEKGEYEIDADATAEKMLKTFFDEMG